MFGNPVYFPFKECYICKERHLWVKQQSRHHGRSRTHKKKEANDLLI